MTDGTSSHSDNAQHACCAPGRAPGGEEAPAPASAGDGATDGMIRLGGSFLMGTEDADGFPQDREGPVREIDLPPFWIDPVAVTNRRFAEFVEATGHRTDAERAGWTFVFAAFLPPDFEPTRGIAAAPWWRQVFGADWRHPEGPQSGLGDDRLDHPVVQVSWNDAKAFCAWSGTRLPHESEWEMAARGGLEQARFPWGDELEPGGRHAMNVWQGTFPARNTGEDGWLGTCPVDEYEPNGLGMMNASGNVWEWCADRFDRQTRAIRGGSFLCHASYCNRYRVAARSFNTPDSSTGNMGFRVARDA
ncbi:MAG TPA: formylglycine-generating enzyme family protein [Solirubrobacterales bacterium]|nr:formylglycine-generating enzyme family protein [Solirubrobacterales bacterium]